MTGGNSGIGFRVRAGAGAGRGKGRDYGKKRGALQEFGSTDHRRRRQAAYSVGDVTCYEDGERALKYTIDTYGKVDILVNNSGICVNKPAHEMTYDEYMRVMNVDLHSIFIMSTIVAVI